MVKGRAPRASWEAFWHGLIWVAFHPSQPWQLAPLLRAPESTGGPVVSPLLLPGTHLGGARGPTGGRRARQNQPEPERTWRQEGEG